MRDLNEPAASCEKMTQKKDGEMNFKNLVSDKI